MQGDSLHSIFSTFTLHNQIRFQQQRNWIKSVFCFAFLVIHNILNKHSNNDWSAAKRKYWNFSVSLLSQFNKLTFATNTKKLLSCYIHYQDQDQHFTHRSSMDEKIRLSMIMMFKTINFPTRSFWWINLDEKEKEKKEISLMKAEKEKKE